MVSNTNTIPASKLSETAETLAGSSRRGHRGHLHQQVVLVADRVQILLEVEDRHQIELFDDVHVFGGFHGDDTGLGVGLAARDPVQQPRLRFSAAPDPPSAAAARRHRGTGSGVAGPPGW
ncbi:hypothetical protein ACFOHS_02735 [Jhaorihella thermophila]